MENCTESQYFHALESLNIPGHKIGLFYTLDMYYDFIRRALNRTKAPETLKNRFSLESIVFLFLPLHFLYKVFDRKIQQYIEADLINYNVRTWREFNNPKKYEPYKLPFTILTLEELEAGFVISLVPLTLSLVVFCIEWMVMLENLIVFMYIFRNYFKTKLLEQKSYEETIKNKMAAAKVLLHEKALQYS